jgi:hypothetical protein
MLYMAQFLDDAPAPSAHFIDEEPAQPAGPSRFVDDGPGIPQTPDEIKSRIYAPGSSYTPTFDEWKILEAEPKSFVKGVKNAATGTASYLKDTLKKVGGEFNAPESENDYGPLATGAGTLIEAGARGTRYLLDNVVKPAFRRYVDHGGTGVTFAGAAPNMLPPVQTPQEVDQNAYQRYLSKLADTRKDEKIASGEQYAFPPFNAAPNVAANIVSKPVAELASNFIDPTILLPAAELPKLASLGERGARLAEKGAGLVEAGARGTKNLARLPQKAISAILPEDRVVAGMVAGTGSAAAQSAGLPVLKTIGVLKGVEAGAAGVEKAAQGAKFLAQTAGDSQFSRLWQMAHNETAPLWLRKVADSLDKTGVEKAAGLAAVPVKGAARGAAVGAGLGAVSSENQEELGGAVGAGATLGATAGTLAHPLHKNARIVEQKMGDIKRFAQKAIENGTAPENLAKLNDETMLAAATLDRVLDGKVSIKVADKDEFNKFSQNPGAAGFYDTGTKTLLINADENLKRGPDDTFYHEITHALADTEVANTPQIKTYIDGLMGPDRLNAAKQEYASKLVLSAQQRNGVLPKDFETSQTFQDLVNLKIKEMDDQNAQQYNDPNHWIYSEIFAEAGLRSLFGKDIMGDVVNSGPLKAKVLDLRQKALEALGVKFPAEVGPSTTLFSSAFDDVLDSPTLRREVYQLVRDRKKFITGTKIKEPTAVVTKDQIGKHPGVPVEQRADGTVGNDFADVMPDGTVILKSAKQVKAIEQARSKEVEANIMSMPVAPLGDADPLVKPRKTIGGLTQVTGTKLGDWFYNLNTFGPEVKKNAKLLEGAIEKGDVVTSWYQAVGTGRGNNYRDSVRKFRGALQVSYREYVPFGFVVTKTGSHNFQGKVTKTGGNILVTSLDLSSANRKAAEWQGRGKLDTLWGGDVEAFKQDLFHYLRNEAQGLPGDTSIGAEKKNNINAFLVGNHATFSDANPLRPSLSGEDKQGLIRTWRLDRINTVKTTDETRGPVNYPRMAQNLTPEAEPRKQPGLEYKGYWDAPKLHLYNLTEDHPELGPKGTTITDVTLKKFGYDAPVPEHPDQQASPGNAVEYDSLPDETKGDIAAWLHENVPALRDEWSPEHVNQELADLTDPVVLNIVQLPVKRLLPKDRAVSKIAVDKYSKMPGQTAPPIVVANGKLLEGGHRVAAAVKRGDATITAIDITPLTKVDWAEFLKSGNDPNFPTKSKTTPPQQATADTAEKLPNAVDKPINVVHYTSRNLEQTDPKMFGRGQANKNDLRGDNKTYFFAEGSPMGRDEQFFGKGSSEAYGATLDGSKIYDLSEGKPDPLKWGSTINRLEADENVQKAGYDGIMVDTGKADGRKVVMMFKPVPVKSLGRPTAERQGTLFLAGRGGATRR